MILAAGLGTRLRPITLTYSKPAVPFINVPLLFWSLELLRELPVSKWVLNTHHLPEQIEALVAIAKRRAPDDFETVAYSNEPNAPLGSGGGIWQARKELAGTKTVLVANADEVILPIRKDILKRMHAAHEKSGALATILTMDHSEAGRKFGAVWTDSEGRVHGFGRDGAHFPKAKLPKHYVGVMLLDSSVLEMLPEGESNILYDTLQTAISKGARINVFNEPLIWFETGNAADYLIATRAILDLINPLANVDGAKKLARDHAGRTLAMWGPQQLDFSECESGAVLLHSDFAEGSLSLEALGSALKKKSDFAVYGSKTLAKAPLLNSVSLPNSTVSAPTSGTVVV